MDAARWTDVLPPGFVARRFSNGTSKLDFQQAAHSTHYHFPNATDAELVALAHADHEHMLLARARGCLEAAGHPMLGSIVGFFGKRAGRRYVAALKAAQEEEA